MFSLWIYSHRLHLHILTGSNRKILYLGFLLPFDGIQISFTHLPVLQPWLIIRITWGTFKIYKFPACPQLTRFSNSQVGHGNQYIKKKKKKASWVILTIHQRWQPLPWEMGKYSVSDFSTQYKLLELDIYKEAVGKLEEGATAINEWSQNLHLMELIYEILII